MSQVKHQGWLVLIGILILISGLRFVVYLNWKDAVIEYAVIEESFRGLAERTKSIKQDRFDVYYELMALKYVVREMDINIDLVREMTDWEYNRFFKKD